jgi:hypothetical protein
MSPKNIEIWIKHTRLWRVICPILGVSLDALWRITYGLKPTILYYLLIRGGKDSELAANGLKIVNKDRSYTRIAEFLSTKVSEEQINAEISKMESSDSINNYFVDIAGSLDQETKLELLNFALDQHNVAMASAYLRFVPILATIKVLLNRSVSEKSVGPQRWHRDWFGYKGVNVFIALTDINENRGMYSAIGFKEIDRRSEIPVHGNDSTVDAYDRDRVADATMGEYIASDSIQCLIGPPGTAALVDNNWVYHKGGHVQEGYRLMLEISYQCAEKPKKSSQKNILESMSLVGHAQLGSLLDTRVRRYMTSKRNKRSRLGWVFHWLARRLTYFKIKNG